MYTPHWTLPGKQTGRPAYKEALQAVVAAAHESTTDYAAQPALPFPGPVKKKKG
jgi:hypothetical protein